MDLSIIIVTHNQFDKVRVCLKSIFNHQPDLQFEIIVVDNGSKEGNPDVLKTEFPEIRLIKQENLGMGAGNNRGAKEATGEYLLILNPDTEIMPGSIKSMIDCHKSDPSAGLVGPKLLYPDGERQISCYRFPDIFLPFFRRTFLGKFRQSYLDYYLFKNVDLDKTQEVDWVMGSCLLLKKSLYDELGGFDERFFMYFEDTDLCKRINRKGLKIIYHPDSAIIHHHGRASAKNHWFVSLLTNKMARVHVYSYLKYFAKWGFFS